MPPTIPGIHHVTAVAGSARENLAFYTDVLGLRLTKRSVNQDDPSVYHLFYGDRTGSTGTSWTCFAYGDAQRGQVGTGQAETTAFVVPADALDWWERRLADRGLDVERDRRFGEELLAVADHDGLRLELVGVPDAPEGDPWPESPVPAERAIRGFHGVTLALDGVDGVSDLLESMGFEAAETADRRTRYRSTADLGGVVDLRVAPHGPRGRGGVGTVHHVAFRVADEDEQREWREWLADRGYRVTPVIDRKYFRSIYFRTSPGVLFEFATEGPGYTVDESVDELGSALSLPARLEDDRERIEAGLPPLDD